MNKLHSVLILICPEVIIAMNKLQIEYIKYKYGDVIMRKLAELITNTLPGEIIVCCYKEDYPICSINDKLLEKLGYTEEELTEATGNKMMNLVYPEDREMVKQNIIQQLCCKKEYELEFRITGKEKNIIWVKSAGSIADTEDGRILINSVTDITKYIERAKMLEKEAESDPLTGLYNRKKAICMINEMSIHKNRGILFVCDIDNFKSLNDTEGHVRGDAALIYLAGLMKRHAGSEVVISRIGGDEYMLFFPERENICGILEKMKKIQDDFADYMKEKYPMLDISFSAGGVKQGESDDFNMLYRKADVQLYRAKERKGCIEIN